MKIVAGALTFTLLGALVGTGIGWLGNPKPVEVPEEGLGFINWVGPILGAGVGGTLGLIFGGGWYASRIVSHDKAARDL